MQAEHDGLVATLRAEGVDVVDGGPMPPRLMNAVYVRDPMCVVRGGAVIGRMGPLMRRGEERYATQAVAALGMPILRTIHGTGMLEGGTVVKLTPRVYAFGASIRCNPEGARQLAEVLAPLGDRADRRAAGRLVDPPRRAPLDGRPRQGAVRRAPPAVLVPRPPARARDRARSSVHEDEGWAINGLAVRPGRARAQRGPPAHASSASRRRGVEVVEVPYGEIQRGGGGIHCTTMELRRDRVEPAEEAA